MGEEPNLYLFDQLRRWNLQIAKNCHLGFEWMREKKKDWSDRLAWKKKGVGPFNLRVTEVLSLGDGSSVALGFEQTGNLEVTEVYIELLWTTEVPQ